MKKFIKGRIRHYIYENNKSNFLSWFSGSKVIESDGSPKLVYHGSDYNFDKFDFSSIGKSTGNFGHYGHGMYFSDSINEAKTYGNYIYECYLNIKNPYTDTDEERDMLAKNWSIKSDSKNAIKIDFDSLFKEVSSKDNVAGEFLQYLKKYGYENGWSKFLALNKESTVFDLNDISDIFMYTTKEDEIPFSIFELIYNLGLDYNKIKYIVGYTYKTPFHFVTDLGNLGKQITIELKKMGFDGVIYGSEYVAFYPEQIFIKKLA